MKVIYFFAMLIFFNISLLTGADELSESEAAYKLIEQEAEKMSEAIQLFGCTLQKVARSVEGEDVRLKKRSFSKCHLNVFDKHAIDKGIHLIMGRCPKRLRTQWGEFNIKFNRAIKHKAKLFNKLREHVELEFLFDSVYKVKQVGTLKVPEFQLGERWKLRYQLYSLQMIATEYKVIVINRTLEEDWKEMMKKYKKKQRENIKPAKR